ncbi:D-aminoacyl-tRNA deacylase [Aestuariispira ectoiniformans]|uniref:D-aminoacyl-tRNA deacylase n=1 Tax=Aestuariispira ectoiniformans TaxID=2775080 RepID=UPI00223C16B6|nr:D-aminoacyl-tRNA deacylase [Aestuariispira ectoiniformans]
MLQRVSEACVRIDGETVGAIDRGLLVLFCAEEGDTDENVSFFARKIALMRIFADEDGKMNRSVVDVGGAVLAVSQFTLAAQWRKGNRPGFSAAADPVEGERLYDLLCAALRDQGLPVETGRFGANMQVGLTNDGPITIVMDSNDA